jgi:peptide/nickel transport system permease protein
MKGTNVGMAGLSVDGYVRYLTAVVRTPLSWFRDQSLLTQFAAVYLLVFTIVGIVGPEVTPYDYATQHFNDDGTLRALEPPSTEHWMGTTDRGEDVFSRLLYGARPTLITAALGGSIIISIGMTVGITAGFIGGLVDTVLMRFTDVVYGVPLIPAAIVLAAFFGTGFLSSVVVIGLILWRGSARVIRSQVLQIKERPFIKIARSSGASSFHIARNHILPNVAPMAVLFFALGVGDAVIIQAGLAFIGVSDPFVPSYGVIVRNAYNSGALGKAVWWSIPPGALIAVTVLSAYLIGRSIEGVDSDRAFI